MSDLKKRLHQIACCAGECRENRIEAWERIAKLEAQLAMYEDYNNMDGEGDWQPPHPIFMITQENDTLKAKLDAVRDALKDHAEWKASAKATVKAIKKALNGEES